MAMSMKSMNLTVGEKPEAMDSGDAKVGGRISTDRAVVCVCPMNCPRFQKLVFGRNLMSESISNRSLSHAIQVY